MLAEDSCTFKPSWRSFRILLHWMYSFELWSKVSKMLLNSLYKFIFSMFYAMIEFNGFLSSWETQALIRLKNEFWANCLSYMILAETSMILRIYRFWPLCIKSVILNWTYCFFALPILDFSLTNLILKTIFFNFAFLMERISWIHKLTSASLCCSSSSSLSFSFYSCFSYWMKNFLKTKLDWCLLVWSD